jgi:hypothetical protein
LPIAVLDEFCRQKVQDEIDFVYTLPCTDIRVTNDEFVVVEQDNLGIASKIVPIVDIYQCLEQVRITTTLFSLHKLIVDVSLFQ